MNHWNNDNLIYFFPSLQSKIILILLYIKKIKKLNLNRNYFAILLQDRTIVIFASRIYNYFQSTYKILDFLEYYAYF